MEFDPTTPARLPLKRPHDGHSGETPAPKRVKRSLKPALEPESEDDNLPQPAPRGSLAKGTPRSPSLPQLPMSGPPEDFTTSCSTPLPRAFGHPPPNSEVNNKSCTIAEDEAPASFQEEWEADPDADVTDMSKITNTEPRAQMSAAAPAHRQPQLRKEWSLIRTSADRPDLNHHSDNPFDFLSAAKLETLIHFWMGDQEASSKLTRMEREILGETRIKKILVKVVCKGATPIETERRIDWIRSAILSVIAQNGADIQEFDKYSRFAINPAKPGYSWIIIPVRRAIFQAIADVRGALDPRSGSLVLFRPWRVASFPIQHLYAIGIHLSDDNDNVPYDVATTDYMDQMRAPLAAHNVKILEMAPAYYGDSDTYCTVIKFGFADGAIPFLINPRLLTKRFWTGLGDSKSARRVQYRWPPKCRLCESESHLSSKCPWRDIEIDKRKPNFYNCRFHDPGWVERRKNDPPVFLSLL